MKNPYREPFPIEAILAFTILLIVFGIIALGVMAFGESVDMKNWNPNASESYMTTSFDDLGDNLSPAEACAIFFKGKLNEAQYLGSLTQQDSDNGSTDYDWSEFPDMLAAMGNSFVLPVTAIQGVDTVSKEEMITLKEACDKKPRIQVTGIISKIENFPAETSTDCYKNGYAAISVTMENAGVKTIYKGTVDEDSVTQSHCGSDMQVSDMRVGDIAYVSIKPFNSASAKGRIQVIRVTPIVNAGEVPK